MSSALYDRIITLPAITGAQSPVDTLESRVAISNVARLADQSAQVVAAWVHDSVLLQRALTTSVGLLWTSGPMVARRRDDGQPYRLRVGLRGFRSGGSGTIEFIIIAVPGTAGGISGWQQVLQRVEAGQISANAVARATISATSAAWLALDRTWIQRQPSSGARSTSDDNPTLDELGGRAVTVTTETAAVVVAAKQITGSGSSAALTGVYAAEYVGP